MIRRLRALWSNFFCRKQLDCELEEELGAYVELVSAERVRAGMTPEDALYDVRRNTGGIEQLKQGVRDVRIGVSVERLLQDLRYALRTLARSPAFTTVAVVTLALGVGANTTVFSVVDAVMLRPLPYLQPERLVEAESFKEHNISPSNLSYPDFLDWRAQNHRFEHLVSYHDNSYALTGVARATHVAAEVVSWDLLPMLGLRPEMGRGFTKDEEKRGTRVALISHSLWQSQFGADKGTLGRTIQLSGETFTVIGVMPADFRFPITAPKTSVWTTMAVDDTPTDNAVTNRGMHFLSAMGRLKPGVTVAQADLEMKAIAARLTKQHPDTNTTHNSARVERELDSVLGDTKVLIEVIFVRSCAGVADCLRQHR